MLNRYIRLCKAVDQLPWAGGKPTPAKAALYARWLELDLMYRALQRLERHTSEEVL